jgi:hypothetical protein
LISLQFERQTADDYLKMKMKNQEAFGFSLSKFEAEGSVHLLTDQSINKYQVSRVLQDALLAVRNYYISNGASAVLIKGLGYDIKHGLQTFISIKHLQTSSSSSAY